MNETDTLTLAKTELDRGVSPCVTSSFQAECVVLLHMLRQHRRDIPVLFLETEHHFAETLRYRDEIAAAWDLNLVVVRAAAPSPGLWRESTQACCGRHKVEPLFAALRGHDTWFTGLRREQAKSRAALEEVEPFSAGDGPPLRKVSPLARWTTAEVWAYARAHDIPLLPLYDRGYTSIGCEPCTTLPLDPSDER
jgi:phosphoadenosine phosphosulfate reductase